MAKRKLNGHALLLAPFPEELLTMPGVAQRLADFTYQRSHRDTRIPATMAALLALSILASNHYLVVRKSGQATSTNLSIILEMASGAGKENLRGAIDEILFAAGHIDLLLDAAASGAALHRDMATGGAMRIMLIDEFGRYLASAHDDSHKGGLLSTMMTFLTAALGVVPPKLYANQKETLPAIVMPYLVFGGMTTAKELDNALGSRDVVNGFLNRMLVVRTDDVRPAKKAGCNLAQLSSEATTSIKRIDEPVRLPNGQTVGAGCMPGVHPEWSGRSGVEKAFDVVKERLLRKVVPNDEAERELQRIDKLSDADYVQGRGDPVTTLWARAAELTIRVAGVLAIGSACENKGLMAAIKPLTMTVEHVRWAERLVFWCTQNMIGVAHSEISEGAEDRARQKLLHAMAAIVTEPPTGRKAKARGWTEFNKLGWLPKAQLIERVRRNAPDLEWRVLKVALDELETSERITVFDANNDGAILSPGDEAPLVELPEGLSHDDALLMRRRAQASKRLGAGIWYRLDGE